MNEVRVADTLRNWRDWKSGSVDELAALGTAFVWALGLEPLPETTASNRINRRTIRYYISNALMDAPDGERRLATYEYRHLLQLLYIKARQHAGDRLSDIRDDLANQNGRTLEQLLLSTVPDTVPPPIPDDPSEFARPADLAAILHRWAYLTGRAGRHAPTGTTVERSNSGMASAANSSDTFNQSGIQVRVEMAVSEGISLTVPDDHPLVNDEDGRTLVLRGIRQLLRDYRRGGSPGGSET